MMKTWLAVRALFRFHPVASTTVAATLAVMGTTGGTGAYWVYVQPNPQIVAVEKPVTNAGQKGIAGDVRAHAVDPSWKPVPKTEFRAGETLWTLRNDCFLHKTSGPITRVFRSIDAAGNYTGETYQLPSTFPPTRTDGCARRNFATPIPKDLAPGRWRYEVAVLFYKNALQPEVRAAFPHVDITVLPEASAGAK